MELQTLKMILELNNALQVGGGECEKPGYYVPLDKTLVSGDFLNRKWYNKGDSFPDEEMIYVGDGHTDFS